MTAERQGPSYATMSKSLTGMAEDVEHRAGGDLWRRISRTLHGRLRGKVYDTEAILAALYPTSWKDYIPKPVGLVSWQARQLTAGIYTDEPRITYVDPETNEPLTDDQVETIKRHRAAAKVTENMLAAHEEMTAPGNGTVWVIPVARKVGEARVWGMRCVVYPAHDQAVVMDPHPESDDECDVTEWRVRMPLPGGQGLFGVAKVTASSATWEEGAGSLKDQPLWPMREGDAVTNPFGEIPATVLRWSFPEPGCFWGNSRDELLFQARAADVGATDEGHIVRFNGFGQWFGKKLKTNGGVIKMGAGTLIEGDDKDSDLKNVSPTPDMSGAREVNDAYLQAAVASNDLNGGALTGSTGITAQAKLVEFSDRDGLRQRAVKQLARAEQRIYDLMRKGLLYLTGAEVLPPAKLIVEYATPPLALDPMHEVQAAERRIALRLTDPFIERANRDRVDMVEAKRRVLESDKVIKSLGIEPKVGGSGPLGRGENGADKSTTPPEVV